MENLGYLAAAYAIIFVVIFLYVLFLWRRQAALEAELRAMEARLRALGETAERCVDTQTAVHSGAVPASGQARSAG
ncbi:MAG TPA: CcmD family protein [Candidatus Binataceae bacterium]|jgi:CcmD family protein|nr:CcmD family protein [Candidatus Binataceae bacterium]